MTSPLQTTMFNGVTPFYNDAISTSARFGVDNVLTNEQDAPSDRKNFTLSMWFKRSKVGTEEALAGGTTDNANYIRFEASGAIRLRQYNTTINLITNALYRDTTAWYHLVVAWDLDNSTQNDRVIIYINGTRQTLATNTLPSNTTTDSNFNVDGGTMHIGAWYSGGVVGYYSGYIADVNFVDGTALAPTAFGETKNGVWIPKTPSGLTYGNNGFRLQFKNSAVTTASSSTIGADTSGKDRHFTSAGILASDCAMPDCPENNFATLNNISEVAPTLSEGNLVWTNMTQANTPTSTFTIPSTGKWYWEVRPTAIGEMMIGVQTRANLAYSGRKTVYYKDGGSGGGSGSIYIEGSGNGGDQAAYTNGDIIAVLYNADDMEISWRKNNTQQGLTFDVTDTDVTPIIHHGSGSGNNSGTFNFGQDSTFAGAVSAGGNADGNGKGDFAYAPPSGFLALCSANLPDLTIGPDSTTQADDHFETILYSASSGSAGAGSSTPQDIGGLDFKPDWVWIKGRSYSDHHFLADSSRGVGKYLLSNVSNAEGSVADTLDEFRSDGFGLGADSTALVNYQNNTYVAWNWKANGGTTNTDAGFSIVTYTGTGSATTFAHGLGGVPEVMIIKNRTGGSHGWSGFYHHLMAGTAAASATDYLTLNGTGALVDDNTIWNDTPPTSTVFTVGTAANTGASKDYVGYFFRSIEGYSKFGIYTGNGNDDGPFVFTGFKPAWLLIKSTVHTESWHIWDNKRVLNGNPNQAILSPDTTGQDTGASTPYDIDFLSNGFKIRDTHDLHNGSGDTHIYLAFAEAPFKFANAR